MRSLLPPGQREVHFKKETPQRRRLVLARMAEAGVRCWLYTADRVGGHEEARQACLAALTEDLLDACALRLVLDSRDRRDRFDAISIRAVLGKVARVSGLVYEHLPSHQEELLWIADAVAWSVGAGGDWSRRVSALVSRTVPVRDPG
ncbi:hypothetical protein [Actinokineospora iranica]|uniref:Uncharacterized protein n=1 Tax=Actinokineospora iranica TaxID=1271860 RepID=A0A1G6QAX2_9PSEU|nr:hypothetical protein [Actinokineospora iranica]SDC88826.1 hypothetical protein SAMN05216174_105156 [Actinokineospora iranica]